MSVHGLNNHGVIIGSKDIAQFHSMATVHTPGLGFRTLFGRPGDETYGFAINDDGIVLGSSYDEDTFDSISGYWDQAGVFRQLPLLPGGTFSSPHMINNRGWMTGRANGENGGIFLFRDGVITGLGNPTPGIPIGITSFSDNGVIVGESYGTGENTTPIYSWYWMEDIGFRVFPGRLTRPNPWDEYKAANASGTFAGLSAPDENIWTEFEGVRTQTGYRGVIADFNNRGEILGRYYGFGTGVIRDGQFTALASNDLGALNPTIFDLNDNGQILGSDVINGRTANLLFTPVPEPSTLLGIGTALGLLALRRRNRR